MLTKDCTKCKKRSFILFVKKRVFSTKRIGSIKSQDELCGSCNKKVLLALKEV